MKAMRGAAMLCAACLIGTGICSLPAPAAVYAAEEETAPEFEGLRYEAADGAVTITGFTSDLTGKVTVPAEIDGLPVTKIGEGAFKYNFKITEVTLPDSITELGKLAFKSCGKMIKATLPKNLTAIPESCFEECRKLESLVIPEPVKSLGELAFAQCLALADLTVPEGLETVGEDAFLNTPWLEAKRAENPFVIINHVLIDGKACSGDITIPSDVTVIGPSAFAHDYYLKNVLVPENVKEIARLGFFNCTGLESITVLNPECKIYDIDGTISNIYNKHQFSFMGAIRGYENSTLQAFCEPRDYPFEVITAVRGDYDLNGKVSSDDAQNVLNYYAQAVAGSTPALNALQKEGTDVNGDGAIDSADAQLILLYYVQNTLAGVPTTWEQLTAESSS